MCNNSGSSSHFLQRLLYQYGSYKNSSFELKSFAIIPVNPSELVHPKSINSKFLSKETILSVFPVPVFPCKNTAMLLLIQISTISSSVKLSKSKLYLLLIDFSFSS